MERAQAETAVTLAAALSAGVYFYRMGVEQSEGHPITSEDLHSVHAVETFKRYFGSGPILPLGQWLPAAGVTFLGLAVITAASPDVGGAAALLVGTGTVLGNGLAIQKDLAVQKGSAELPSTQRLEDGSAPNVSGGTHPAVLHSPPAPVQKLKVVTA